MARIKAARLGECNYAHLSCEVELMKPGFWLVGFLSSIHLWDTGLAEVSNSVWTRHFDLKFFFLRLSSVQTALFFFFFFFSKNKNTHTHKTEPHSVDRTGFVAVMPFLFLLGWFPINSNRTNRSCFSPIKFACLNFLSATNHNGGWRWRYNSWGSVSFMQAVQAPSADNGTGTGPASSWQKNHSQLNKMLDNEKRRGEAGCGHCVYRCLPLYSKKVFLTK